MPICPHCYSSYTTEKGIAKNTNVMAREYHCDNCGKYFQIETNAKAASGTWLMTAWREEDRKTFISIYKTPEGRIQINQSYDDQGHVSYHSGEITPTFFVKKLNNNYCMFISTKDGIFDSKGTSFYVGTIDMNPDLGGKAMSNTEMRTTYKQYKQDKENERRFTYFSSENRALVEARCDFLRSLIGGPIIPAVNTGGYSEAAQEPVGFVQALNCLSEEVPRWLGGLGSIIMGVFPLFVFLLLATNISPDDDEVFGLLFVTVVVTLAVEATILYVLGSTMYKKKKRKK